MSKHTPQDLVALSRKHLMLTTSILKDSGIEAAIQSTLFGLATYVKHAGILIRKEKQEYEELLTKAIHLLSLDPAVKAVRPEPLQYVPKQERELLAVLAGLPGRIQALKNQRRDLQLQERAMARDERFAKGRQLVSQRYFEGAVGHFKRLADDYPEDAKLMAKIGKLLFEVNHIECITFLEKAVALDPRDVQSLVMLGMALRKTRKFDKAEEAYTLALRAMPDDVNILFDLGKLSMDSADWPKAQGYLRKVLQLAPGLAPAQAALEFATRNCRESA